MRVRIPRKTANSLPVHVIRPDLWPRILATLTAGGVSPVASQARRATLVPFRSEIDDALLQPRDNWTQLLVRPQTAVTTKYDQRRVDPLSRAQWQLRTSSKAGNREFV